MVSRVRFTKIGLAILVCKDLHLGCGGECIPVESFHEIIYPAKKID